MKEPNQFIIVLKKIWPTVNRLINDFFYFLITLIKGIVKYAIRQVQGE